MKSVGTIMSRHIVAWSRIEPKLKELATKLRFAGQDAFADEIEKILRECQP